MSQKNFFKLCKENSSIGRDYYFYFKIDMIDESIMAIKYQYSKVITVIR